MLYIYRYIGQCKNAIESQDLFGSPCHTVVSLSPLHLLTGGTTFACIPTSGRASEEDARGRREWTEAEGGENAQDP